MDSPLAIAHDNSSVQAIALDGGRTQLVWTKDVLPDDVARRVSEVMESGLAAMRTNLERTFSDETRPLGRTPARLLALGAGAWAARHRS